jgi:signal transduction histidine kinase
MDRSYASTERLIKMVHDMLNVSRIESGRLTINPIPTDMVTLAHEVLEELSAASQTNHVTVNLKEPTQALPQVLADQEKIKEVMINLIGNSLKFTPDGGSITVSFACKDSMVTTSITDTGKGLTQDDIPRLFQKFGMLEKNYLQRSRGEGSGLGLYICKSIVEMHGGTISVTSEGQDKGSTFSFSLKII